MDTKTADSIEKNSVVLSEDQKSHDDDEIKAEYIERGNWGGKLDFLLSCIGFAVGLGNVWRFPYLCYRNGGGAFLIPYTIMLAFVGIPLFYMELALGQFASEGPITVWKMAPLFKGLGWAMAMISGLVAIYYNVIIAWTIYYFIASLTSRLPWMDCNNAWNTPDCKAWDTPYCNITSGLIENCTNATGNVQSPSEQYWERSVLGISDGIDQMGEVRWKVIFCLMAAWVVIFLCIIKGIKSSGKVVYFTATFPYIVLTILLVRGCTLPGAKEGIMFYITPDWSKLTEAKVWGDAASQLFYSLGVAWGGLEVMASYNKFKNNCYRDALIVSVTNCATSVFAGFVIFSVIGFMSVKMGVPIDKVAKDGPGLAFVAYPEGIAQMPIAPLWSVLFFLMLFTLGLDSQFAMMETVISAISDEFLVLRKYKRSVTAGLCLLLFLLGIPCCTQAGMYWLNLVDWYSASYSLMVVALLESVVVAWIYGYKNFSRDIEMMLGFQPNIFWKACWMIISPGLILFILIFSATNAASITYGSYQYPCWAQMMGIAMIFASLIFIPIMMGVETCKLYGFKKTVKIMLRPQSDWGPFHLEHRTGIYALPPYNQHHLQPRNESDIFMVVKGANYNEGFDDDENYLKKRPISSTEESAMY